VWVKNVTWESQSHSWECWRMWRNEPTHSKWAPTLGIKVSMDFWMFWEQFEKSKFIGLKSFIRSILRRRCLKQSHMIHLYTYNTSYGQKKGQESKCQFDLQLLKVENRSKLHACRWGATYHWKVLDKSYKFSLDLTLIGGLLKKLWASKVVKVSVSKLPNWES